MKFGDIEISVYVVLAAMLILYNGFIILLALSVSPERYERLLGIMKLRTIKSPLEGIVKALRKRKK